MLIHYSSMSDVTHLLNAAAAGDRRAAADLFPLVYEELRKLAAAKMASENPGHTLDATALVHEAFLRLTGEQSFSSRSHFMRRGGTVKIWVALAKPRLDAIIPTGCRPVRGTCRLTA